MVAAPTTLDGELLRHAQAGDGLAGVDDLGLGACDDIGVLPRPGGNTR